MVVSLRASDGDRIPARAPDTSPPWSRQVLRGILGVPRGMAFTVRHPSLTVWILLPLLLNLALAVVMVRWATGWAEGWTPAFENPWWWGVDLLRPVVAWSTGALLWILAVLAGLLAALALSGVVNSPFYEVLSERTESLAGGSLAPPRPWSLFLADLAWSLRVSLSLLVRQVLVLTPLFLLSFTTVGAPLFAIAGFYYTGLALVDPVLARRRTAGAERARWGRRRFPLLMLLGLPVVMLPPLAPFGVVGAVLSLLDEDAAAARTPRAEAS